MKQTAKQIAYQPAKQTQNRMLGNLPTPYPVKPVTPRSSLGTERSFISPELTRERAACRCPHVHGLPAIACCVTATGCCCGVA